MKKSKFFYNARIIFLWIVGSLIFSVSINTFTVPGNFIQGGMTGISLMLHHTLGTPVGLTALILNIPLFVWAYKKAGKIYFIKSALATAISSITIDVSARFLPVYTGDKLLSAIFAGLLCGVGLGIIYISGATTGGSDLAAYLILQNKPSLSVGRLIFIIDAIICAVAVLVYGSLESAMYASVLIYTSGRIMDATLDGAGLSGGRVFFIISEKARQLSDAITSKALRGVTVINGQSYYSGQNKNILVCAVRRHEISKMYTLISLVDKNSFVFVCPASDIKGYGFSKGS